MTDALPTSFLLTSEGVTRITKTGDDELRHEAPRDEFWKVLSGIAPFSSGILPPGVISVRQGAGFTQLVIETPPGVYLTCWGASEGSGHAVYRLGMPWRYIVGLYKGPDLQGARLFYSPKRVTHERQVLYHSNVPNINCKGYGTDNGVGWVCLYHLGYKATDLADMARYLTDRASGCEPYNDGNMSETDGPRFYHGMLQAAEIEGREFLYDPKVWEAKTEAEGFEWTLDDSLWVPIRVQSEAIQTKHVPGGVPLTLGMVMTGPSKFYYDDPNQPKLFDAAVLGLDWGSAYSDTEEGVRVKTYGGTKNNIAPLKQLWDSLQAGFTHAIEAAKATKKVELDTRPLEDPPTTFAADLVPKPSSFWPKHTIVEGSDGEDEDISYCDCGNEVTSWDDDDYGYCESCWPYKECVKCFNQFPSEDMVKMTEESHRKVLTDIIVLTEENLLCRDCFSDLTDEAAMIIAEAEEREADEEPVLAEPPPAPKKPKATKKTSATTKKAASAAK